MAQRDRATIYSYETGEKITPRFEAGVEQSVHRHPSSRIWPVGRVLPPFHDTAAIDAGIVSKPAALLDPHEYHIKREVLQSLPPTEHVRTGEGVFQISVPVDRH